MTNDEYIAANWPKLSPKFREAHNRLRRMKGMSSIPEPRIDLYVPPRGPSAKPFDFNSPEFLGAAREFMGPRMMGGGPEGFTINGNPVK
jgi:hypothetical protein